MEIALAIKYLYPNLEQDIDFITQDNGKGQILIWLNDTIIEPTQEELETAWVAVQAVEKLATDSLARKEAILQIATLSDQINLMAKEIYKLTANSTDPETIAARTKFEEIQTILTV